MIGASFSVPFLRLSVGTDDRSKLLCTLKSRYGALHTRFDDYAPHNVNHRGLIGYYWWLRPAYRIRLGFVRKRPRPGVLFSMRGYAFVTLKLVCRKYPKNNEFRTKKFLNQKFLYGISSFCTLSENNSFLHGKISCFCIFLAKNGVFNTDSNSPQWAMLS